MALRSWTPILVSWGNLPRENPNAAFQKSCCLFPLTHTDLHRRRCISVLSTCYTESKLGAIQTNTRSQPVINPHNPRSLSLNHFLAPQMEPACAEEPHTNPADVSRQKYSRLLTFARSFLGSRSGFISSPVVNIQESGHVIVSASESYLAQKHWPESDSIRWGWGEGRGLLPSVSCPWSWENLYFPHR